MDSEEEQRDREAHEPVREVPDGMEPPEPHSEMRAPRVARRPVLPTNAEIGTLSAPLEFQGMV